jgi:hypothetical protein
VDGELSACEAAQFEASLTEAERTRLASEMRFERALSDRLRDGGACPVATWQRARSMALDCDGARSRVASRRWIYAGATLAAAAAFAFVLSNVTGLFDAASDSNVIHAAESIAQLTAESETEPGWENVQTYLDAHGVRLSLTDYDRIMTIIRPHPKLEIIGARTARFGGSEVTELLVACCDKPVKVILAPKHSSAAHALAKAAAEDGADIQATRKVDGYVAAVVATHPAHGLVNLVDAESD